MLSKEMYNLLKLIPRHPSVIDYAELKASTKLEEKEMQDFLCEAIYGGYDYINSHEVTVQNGSFSLTEKGQAAIEAYEQEQRNQKTMQQSLCAARWALIAAAISAITSVIALLSNIC